jgi:hypothetical protein
MKRFWLLMTAISALIGMVTPALAYNGKSVNGKAVSVQWRYGEKDWAPMTCESGDDFRDGAILLYTIQNSNVTHCDTIHPREKGLAQYPAFNLSGTKIAFYHLGRAPATTGNGCVSVNGGKSYISIINPDGTGLTDLFELPGLPNGEFFPLDWPAGDWIYFEMPHDAAHSYAADRPNASLMIWRVNAVTKAAEKVCNFTEDGSGTEIVCGYIHRFTLTAKADYMALMVYPKYNCAVDAGMDHVNDICHFPPPNGNIRTSSISYRDGCNISISPSGAQVGSYLGGSHDVIFLSGTQVSIKDMESWAGESIGCGAECIRWSENSDKWVGQCIGFVPSGHAGSQVQGCNQVICNWIDKVAINVSKNPHTDPGDVNGQGVIRWNNCTGDFWVDDPANNPNKNSYEDLQGVWRAVPGATAVEDAGAAGRDAALGGTFSIASSIAPAIRVHIPHQAPWKVSIAGVDGRTIRSLTGASAGDIAVPLADAGSGIRVITLTQGGKHFVNRCMAK